MDVTALVFSIIAVVWSGGISSWALWYAHRADARATRAEERARLADERDADRLAREATAVDLANRAELDIGGTEVVEEPHRFVVQLRVRNLGPSVARNVRVWLVDAEGRVASNFSAVLPHVLRADPDNVTPIFVTGSLPVPDGLRVRGSWTDLSGRHEDEPLGPWGEADYIKHDLYRR